MSLATSAAPPASAPETAKLLLPGLLPSFLAGIFSNDGSSVRRSMSALGGVFGQVSADPAIGASHAPPLAVRNRYAGSEQRRMHCAKASSRVFSASFNVNAIAATTSGVSSSRHGARRRAASADMEMAAPIAPRARR